MPRLFAAALIPVLLTAVGCMPSNPPTVVDSVDLQRYSGTWYEIASYPVQFDQDAIAVTARYEVIEPGVVSVENRGLRSDFDGEPVGIDGSAEVVDDSGAKLVVRFDRFPASLFPGDYWIVDLDEQNYTYAVVSNPQRSILYILYREPQIPGELYDDILARLAADDFDLSRLEVTPQIEGEPTIVE